MFKDSALCFHRLIKTFLGNLALKVSSLSGQYSRYNSQEIPQNWSPKWEICVGSQFREIPEQFLGIFPHKISQNTSPEIHKKFQVLGHNVYGLLRECIERISFEKLMGTSQEFHPKKILRISPDYFYGNSWEILRTWSPCLGILKGI